VTRRPIIVVLALLAVAIVLPVTGGEIGFGSATPSPSVAGSGETAAPSPTLPAAGPTSTPEPTTAAATPDPTPTVAEVPIVPVTQFRTTRTTASLKEVRDTLTGTSTRYDAVELVASEADAILAALGVERPAAGDAKRLVEAKDAATLKRDLAKHRRRLAFLRLDDVGPSVRALGWRGERLFGDDRVDDLGEWQLDASLPVDPAAEAFDPARTWTLVAGGDIMLDRGVYDTLVRKGRGDDFMFDGGTGEITGLDCCSSFGWEVPRLRRTGDKGAVRDLIKGADIAMANFENPAPNSFRWHTSGTVFSADQRLIDGLADAGFDYMGVANNHIRDQGANGLLQTVKNLNKRGIKTSGAGRNLKAARKPAMFEIGDTTVAILAYDAIAKSYHATGSKVGSAPMTAKLVAADVRAARKAGADVVVVFPHWGVEYRATPSAGQRKLARQIIDAGADMIIGNHAHWTAAMETYKGKPIWYALGNLVFDQTWSAETMEGMTLELTFHGSDLEQVVMRPHVIFDKAQPNFLDPAKSGKVVMDRVFDASTRLAW
jgi:Bacterial capsule synthesis protein PGA_cap